MIIRGRAFATAVVAASLVLCLAACQARSQAVDPRIGFAEEFDSIEGWKPTSDKNPLESMKAVDGVAVFDTYVGSFQYPTKPPAQPIAVRATTAVYKEYDQEVDLDKYHYVVMKIDEKSMYSILEINKKSVQVAYTTGIMAQDLKQLGFTGKQKIRIDLDIMNNNRELKADYIRLVSELTDEEKAHLVRPPVRLYKEGIEDHLYQRLEALNARAARVWRDGAEEKAIFRDVGTGAVTWRMTADPADEGFSERFRMWTPNGSAFCGRQGYVRTYLFEKDEFRRGRIDQLDPPKYRVSTYDRQNPQEIKVYRRNAKTGQEEIIYKTSKAGNKGIRWAIRGDKVAVLIAGVKLAVINGAEDDPEKRAKDYPVPKDLSCKGGSLSSDGKYFQYFSPFGCYRQTMVNTDTGELSEGSLFTFTHGMGGRPWAIMSYSSNAKLQVASAASYGGNSTPGDLLKVHGVYLDEVRTDYGAMTRDGRYGYTNGLGGELATQHLMFDRADAGTILRLATYHVSKIDWHVWTKTIASPDYTKLMYVSDMLGSSDYFMAVIRLPDPPQEAKAVAAYAANKVTWQSPARAAEIKGYNVYRSNESGRGYKRINQELITATEYEDRWPAGRGKSAYYLIAAQEHSGLEGSFSQEAAVGADEKPVRLHFEAEGNQTTLPMRQIFDGHASGYRGMRITKVADGEDAGSLKIQTNVPGKGDYWVWARCRNRFSGKGTFALRCHVVADDLDVTGLAAYTANLAVNSKAWQWVRSSGKLQMAPSKAMATVAIRSNDDGLAIDKIIVTDDGDYTPQTADDRTDPPPAVEGLTVAETTANSISLTWQPAKTLGHHYYTVYVGEKADFEPGNETVLCSTYKTSAVDWDIKLGSTYYYKVVATDRRGRQSAPATIEAKTKPLDVFKFEQAAVDAKLDQNLRKAKDEDVDYVAGPAAGEGEAVFEFDAPADGTYYLWAEYGSKLGRPKGFPVRLDDTKGQWRTHEPGRMGRPLRGGAVRWFVQRVPVGSGQYANKLSKGKHTLAFNLDNSAPLLSKVWVTNDPSFIPPGYSTQMRFNRDRRQK